MREAAVPKGLLESFRADPFGRLLGAEVEEVRPGYARASLQLRPEHRNFHGVVHGGLVFSLADVAFAAASNSHNQRSLAVSATIHFLRAPAPGRLEAECTEEHRSRSLGSYRVVVRDSEGRLVATMQALVYRQEEPVIPTPP
ncbi:MAG: PaaI family thioesterase [Armatimonadota bacterium]|nr:PaaI family thioesterase [Armatimonadota bacterium]MDW8156605.1 PaaI family thioesterase [Armatimonadota bacterium]